MTVTDPSANATGDEESSSSSDDDWVVPVVVTLSVLAGLAIIGVGVFFYMKKRKAGSIERTQVTPLPTQTQSTDIDVDKNEMSDRKPGYGRR